MMVSIPNLYFTLLSCGTARVCCVVHDPRRAVAVCGSAVELPIRSPHRASRRAPAVTLRCRSVVVLMYRDALAFYRDGVTVGRRRLDGV